MGGQRAGSASQGPGSPHSPLEGSSRFPAPAARRPCPSLQAPGPGENLSTLREEPRSRAGAPGACGAHRAPWLGVWGGGRGLGRGASPWGRSWLHCREMVVSSSGPVTGMGHPQWQGHGRLLKVIPPSSASSVPATHPFTAILSHLLRRSPPSSGLSEKMAEDAQASLRALLFMERL